MSVILFDQEQDLNIATLLRILKKYAESENQKSPYLIKDGIKIIL